jgi:hypothetical protein
MTINVISHTQSTHGQVLSPQYHFNNYHFFYYWSVCTKPGKWAVMYMCVKGIDFALFSLEFSINSLELFRPCGILYFFHFIDNKRYYSYPINRLGKEFWYHNTIVYSSHFTAVCTRTVSGHVCSGDPFCLFFLFSIRFRNCSERVVFLFFISLTLSAISHTNSTCLLPSLVIPTLPVYYHN